MSGISSCRGFFFQEEVFFYYLFKENFTLDNRIGFELTDDVSIEDLYKINFSNTYIQVKTGNLSTCDYERIFENWLILTNISDYKNNKYIIFSEQKINMLFDDDFCEQLKNEICQSNDKDKRSIRRQAYEKLKKLPNGEIHNLIKHIADLVEVVDLKSLEEIKKDQQSFFENRYCTDTDLDLNLPRQARCQYVMEKIHQKLKDAIENKEPFILTYEAFFNILIESTQKFNNEVFNPDYVEFKKNNKTDIDKLSKEHALEIQQLKMAKLNEGQIYDDLIKELFYKKIVNYYKQKNNSMVESTHEEAKNNYEEAIQQIEYDGKEQSPKNIYFVTTQKEIKSPMISQAIGNSSFLRKGCYIFMTSLNVPDSLRIKWGDINEKNK